MAENLQIIASIAVLLIFIACGAIAVLDMIGKVEIRKEYQRKTLFSVLIVEAVAIPIGITQNFFDPAVAAFAGEEQNKSISFSSSGGGKFSVKTSEVETEIISANPDKNDNIADIPDADDKDIEAEDPKPKPKNKFPQEILDWAAINLGDRPPGIELFNEEYPSCVKRIATRENMASHSRSAIICAKTLEAYRSEYIKPYYDIKKNYDENLKAWEIKLRTGNEDAIAKWKYVNSESQRLNTPVTGELAQVAKLDSRSAADNIRCFKNNCRPI